MTTLEENECEKLLNRVLSQIKKYDVKARYFRNWTYSVRISTFFLAGLITIFAGWKSTDTSTSLQNWILICSAASTFLITLAAFWNVERHWIANVLTAQRFKLLRDQVRQIGDGDKPPTQFEIDELKKSYIEILNSKVEFWEKIQDSHTN